MEYVTVEFVGGMSIAHTRIQATSPFGRLTISDDRVRIGVTTLRGHSVPYDVGVEHVRFAYPVHWPLGPGVGIESIDGRTANFVTGDAAQVLESLAAAGVPVRVKAPSWWKGHVGA
jgi:hypothetical protein